MISNPKEIPSAFVRMDTRVNSVDSFANVRDMQLARLNHNILLARRARKKLFGLVPGTISSNFVAYFDGGPVGNGVFLNVPIRITPWTESIRVIIRAANDGGDQNVYFKVRSPTGFAFPGSSYATVTSGSYTRHAVDVPLKPEVMAAGEGFLLGWADGGMGGSDVKGTGELVTAVGTNYVRTTTGGTQLGHVVYFPSHPEVAPRRIVGVADSTMIFVDRPWNIWPQVGWDVSIRASRSIAFESICAYEIGPASFDEVATEL